MLAFGLQLPIWIAHLPGPKKGLFYVVYQKAMCGLTLAFMAKRLEICTKNTTDFSTDSIHIVGVFFSVASLGLGPTTIENYSIRYLK